MTALQKLWCFLGLTGNSALTWLAGFHAGQHSPQAIRIAPANQAALRLASLPRGFRQRSRCFLMDV
jgi:hypothetical protein